MTGFQPTRGQLQNLRDLCDERRSSAPSSKLSYLLVGALVVSALAGCGAAPTVAPVQVPAGKPSAAMAGLDTLQIKGRAPMTGYARAEFGDAWTDSSTAPWSGNGLSTRDDVLSRDLTSIVCKTPAPKKAAPHCVVNSGILADPYTGRTIQFKRGETSSMAVQIDHVSAEADAWQKGAQQLTREERTAFANDPLNLIAVDGPTNQQKGASDAASWLPPNKKFRCSYVARQVAVKVKYHLWVTAAEKNAMTNVLTSCPGQPLPTAADATRQP